MHNLLNISHAESAEEQRVLLMKLRDSDITSSQSITGCFASPGERRELAQFLRFGIANQDI